MTTAVNGFDATQVPPTTPGGAQIPVSSKDGWPMIIVNDEVKPSKNDPNCGVIHLSVQIIAGELKGTEGVIPLNYFHTSEVPARIAKEQLSSICHAVGILKPTSIADLYNRPFGAVYVMQKDETKGTQFRCAVPYGGELTPAKPSAPTIPAASSEAPKPAWQAPASGEPAKTPPWGQPA